MSGFSCKKNRDIDSPKRMNELELKRLRREVETTHVAFDLMTEACRQWQDRANELEEKHKLIISSSVRPHREWIEKVFTTLL